MKPTEPQITLLRSYSIEPLSTKERCHRLISFIKEGNGSDNKTETERIQSFHDAQRKFIGRQAKYCFDGREVKISLIVPKDRREVTNTRKTIKELGGGQPPNPFMAGFKYLDTNRGGFTSLGNLTWE